MALGERSCPLQPKGCPQSEAGKCTEARFIVVCPHREYVQVGYGTPNFKLDVCANLKCLPIAA